MNLDEIRKRMDRLQNKSNGKSSSEEDIAIEEIIERVETIKKPKPIHVVQQKKAV